MAYPVRLLEEQVRPFAVSQEGWLCVRLNKDANEAAQLKSQRRFHETLRTHISECLVFG